MPFKRGQSGNPAGRPVGSRNKRTIVAEKLFGENGEYFTQLLIELAEKGHSRALRLYIDLFCPRARRRRAAFRLPPVATASDALGAINALVQGVAHGKLAPKRAAELSMKVRTALQVAHESGMRQRIQRPARSADGATAPSLAARATAGSAASPPKSVARRRKRNAESKTLRR